MWFDGKLRRLKKLKRKVYFKFLKKSDVFSKAEYNKIKNDYERVIKTKKDNNSKQQLKKYRPDAKSLWNIINKIVGKSCYKYPNYVEVNNTIVFDEQNKADYFNTSFSSTAKKLSTQLPPPNQQNISLKNSNTKNSFFFNPMTISEIKRIILSLTPKTSFGLDNFPAKLLRVLNY